MRFLSLVLAITLVPLAARSQAQQAFSLVVLPDTQNYVNSATNAPIFTAQTQWIRTHIESGNDRNIGFVSHVGDVVNTATNSIEWTRAVESMDVLRAKSGFVVPHGILPGNHDYQSTGNKQTGAATFAASFGPAAYVGAPWYGGAEASGTNSYQVFSAGGREYLHLALEWQPTANVPVRDPSPIEWAQGVIAAHPDLPVILSTHEYLDEDPPGRSGAGNTLFDELVRTNDQIFLVLCGHYHSGNQFNSGEYHQVSLNNFGKPVVEMLQDFQDYTAGGNGWLRLVEIDEAGDAINVETYSPWLDQYQTETIEQVGGFASQFTIAIDFATRFEFVAPPEPPAEIYDETVFAQGLNGYVGTEDKEIRSSGGDAANGDETSISVDGDDGSPGLQPNHGLVRFDGIIGEGPGLLAPNSEVEEALLVLNVIDPGSGLRVYGMTTTWDEATTWAALGGNGATPGVECDAAPLFTIGADNSSANVPTGTLTIDVTALVQAWVNGERPNHGIALIPFTNGTNGVDISTSESTAPPKLVIRSLKRGLILADFRQDVDGYAGVEDTQIRQAEPTTTQGDAASFSIDADDPNGTGNANHVLMRFAELNVATDAVVRATLFLTGSDTGAGGSLYRMLIAWDENATWAADFGGDGVQANGVEAMATADALVVGTTGEVAIDVTAAVRSQLEAGQNSIDWVFLPAGNDGWDIASSEAAESLRPRLQIVVEAEAPCIGDFDQSGAVDGADLAVLLGAWGTNDSIVDLNADRTVDGADLAILLGAWGACSPG